MPRFRPQVTPLEGQLGVAEMLDAWRDLPGLVALDSAADLPGWSGGGPRRFSVVGFEPLREPAGARNLAGVRRLARQLAGDGGDPVPGPFAGGFIGALAYDLGPAGEDLVLPADPWNGPPVVGGLYTDFAVLDHDRGAVWLVLGDGPGDGRAPVKQRREHLLDRLAEGTRAGEARATAELERHVSAAEHRRRIEAARDWIGAGEFYQVNLAQRFTQSVSGHPVDLYLRLRAANPGAYNAYLAWGLERDMPAGALLSTSPELLLACDGDLVCSRPIKGTIGRARGEAEDRARIEHLLADPKERAELAMIVDLQRNDLGRVARVGSVRVEHFPGVETYRGLHHLVADVRARLRPGLDAGDALAALFPGGSITGAPKLRAMQAIAELEGHGRGFFTGSAGFLDTRGHGAWNILIRTAVWRRRAQGGEVSLQVGGGITWSSEARAEERETRLKGAAVAAALASSPEDSPGGLSLGIDLQV
jgi:para-aminobenzoate synthetase component I